MNKPSSYVCPDGAPFPVEWFTPGMAESSWTWDQVKNPVPLTPLSWHFLETKRAGMARASEQIGRPSPSERIYANGYVFARSLPVSEELAERSIGVAAEDEKRRIDWLLELWHTEYLPEVEELIHQLQNWSHAGDTLAEMVGRFPEVDAISERLGELHNLAIVLSGVTMSRFQAFCRDEFGDDGGQIAIDTVAGMPNKSVESGIALWDLSRQLPESISDAQMSASPLLAEFLTEWGQRNESFFEIAYRTWLEEPSFVLTTLKGYRDSPNERSPTAMQASVAAHRVERTEEAKIRLGHARKVHTFDQLLRRAQHNTTLMEDHQFHIDQRAHSSLRYPSLAIGDALVIQGTIDSRDDVFYLHPSEFKVAANEPVTRFQSLTKERRAERERWIGVIPPRHIGGEPVKTAQTSDLPSVIHGSAASAGSATGTARVILTLEDAHRLSPGDVLVTYATAPPWTPLFAIAAAIVTDAGGALSHCAIVAREYGIPAVVGATGATATIADGATVSVDGTSGTITLMSRG